MNSPFPLLDEHATEIAAGVDDVWLDLLHTLDRGPFPQRLTAGIARAVGCADRTASGPRPLTAGSTVPGFRVEVAVPGSELALEGRHRYSSYALTFRLDQVNPDRSRLRAESRAAFPGVAGGIYRLAIIGTGGHVVVVRRLLSVIKRRSEARTASDLR